VSGVLSSWDRKERGKSYLARFVFFFYAGSARRPGWQGRGSARARVLQNVAVRFSMDEVAQQCVAAHRGGNRAGQEVLGAREQESDA